MNVVEDDDAIRLELAEVLDQTSASTRDPQPHQVGVIFSFAQATEEFRDILFCGVSDNGLVFLPHIRVKRAHILFDLRVHGNTAEMPLGQAVNFFVFPADTIENQRAQAYNSKGGLT